MPQPWVKPPGLLWDGDITPEGMAVKYASGPFFANAFGFWLSERSAASDATLLGGQLGMIGNIGGGEADRRGRLLRRRFGAGPGHDHQHHALHGQHGVLRRAAGQHDRAERRRLPDARERLQHHRGAGPGRHDGRQRCRCTPVCALHAEPGSGRPGHGLQRRLRTRQGGQSEDLGIRLLLPGGREGLAVRPVRRTPTSAAA